jgi:hypothetical protein
MSPAQEAAIRAAAIALHNAQSRLVHCRLLLQQHKDSETQVNHAVAEALEQACDGALRKAQYQWQEPGPPLSSCLDELAGLITTQAGYDALSVALERARRALEDGV